jgi:hypothetical protein
MIRSLALASAVCLVGAIVAASAGEDVLAIVLFLAWLVIGLVLLARRLFHGVRDAVRDAHAFVSGDIQHARILEVGEPKGWFSAESNVVLELEAEDGTKRQFDRDLPIPFFLAWGYQLSKRLRLPLISKTILAEMLRFEFRREGMEVSVSRAPAGLPSL